VDVNISKESDSVLLKYKDNGPGYPELMLKGDWNKTSVGFDLIRGIVKRNLRGDVRLKNNNGAECSIIFDHESIKTDKEIMDDKG
jgi:two-component system, sensor histidine kinase PdtaS